MPIYEYRCEQCGHELEKLQRMSDELLRDCPACEKPELRRLISAAGFRLKGGGWYETDFKQGSKRNLADSGNEPSKDASDSGNGASGPKDSKAETVKSSKKETARAEAKPAKDSTSSTA